MSESAIVGFKKKVSLVIGMGFGIFILLYCFDNVIATWNSLSSTLCLPKWTLSPRYKSCVSACDSWCHSWSLRMSQLIMFAVISFCFSQCQVVEAFLISLVTKTGQWIENFCHEPWKTSLMSHPHKTRYASHIVLLTLALKKI